MWRKYHDALVGRLTGWRALEQATETWRIERKFTYPNFERSAERCGDVMRAAGLNDVTVEEFPADGVTQWSGWGKMRAWDVASAKLWMVAPRRELLADWDVKPHQLTMYSGPCETEAEVVEWDGSLDVDLGGKIPLVRHRINDVFAQMRQLRIHGVVSDFIGTLPGIRDRFDLPDDVRWENSAIRLGHGANWGFQLTPRQGDMLRELLREGPVRLRAEIDARSYEGIFKSATGVIRGAEEPEKELLFVSHLYEPGGNDNASGVGVGLELACALQKAIDDGVLPRPRRSIRFLFNWEGYGLYAWMHRHEDRVPNILGGVNIDEIGADQAKCRSVLHLFMPPAANPSCIGDLIAHLCGEVLAPGVRWKAVADRAEIINDTITSDPHMDVVLPCLIQYPSKNYHTSADTLDTLSAEVMERIGLTCASHLLLLADAGEREAAWLAQLVAGRCWAALDAVGLRLLSGTWPFGVTRTRDWFAEQFALKTASLERFGLGTSAREALDTEVAGALADWCDAHADEFRPPAKRAASFDNIARAEGMVLRRETLGSPKSWGSFKLTGEEDQEYRRILYGNNLDFMLHRLCYWADGSRSLLAICERLEVEMDEVLRDTSISRTSSGAAISGDVPVEIDLSALLYMADLMVSNGYLSVAT